MPNTINECMLSSNSQQLGHHLGGDHDGDGGKMFGDSYLFAFDFDHTVVNENSDVYIEKLAKSPIDVYYDGTNWIERMNKVFDALHKQGVTIQEISRCVQRMEATKGMIPLLKSLVQLKTANNIPSHPPTNSSAAPSTSGIVYRRPSSASNSNQLPAPPKITLLIVSDANTMFITDFLKAQVLSEAFTSSFSKPNLNYGSKSAAFPFDIITNWSSVPSSIEESVPKAILLPKIQSSSTVSSSLPVAENEISNENVNTTNANAVLNNKDGQQHPAGNENESSATKMPTTTTTTSIPSALSVSPFTTQTGCKLCPSNLCKGSAILDYMKANGPFTKVFYTGDGGNDICPALKLSQHDVVFVRKDYRMHKKLQKSPNSLGITAKLVYWEDAEMIKSTINEVVPDLIK